MKTIKVIDLLKRSLELDTTLPEKILYKDIEFIRLWSCSEQIYYYETINTCENLMDFLDCFTNLTDEVKIMEQEDAEFEDIKELTQDCFNDWSEAKRINQLIRNQEKLISIITELKGDK